MLQLRVFCVANVAFTHFFCREYRGYALFGVEFLAEICQKFSEILRILAEILRKKLVTGASVRNKTNQETISVAMQSQSKRKTMLLEYKPKELVELMTGHFLLRFAPSTSCLISIDQALQFILQCRLRHLCRSIHYQHHNQSRPSNEKVEILINSVK